MEPQDAPGPRDRSPVTPPRSSRRPLSADRDDRIPGQGGIWLPGAEATGLDLRSGGGRRLTTGCFRKVSWPHIFQAASWKTQIPKQPGGPGPELATWASRAGRKPDTPQPSPAPAWIQDSLSGLQMRTPEKKKRKERNHMHFQGPGLGLPPLGLWPHQVPQCLAAQTQDSCKVTDISGPLTLISKVLDLFPAPGTSAGRVPSKGIYWAPATQRQQASMKKRMRREG